jgi:hypothetical protein
VEIVRQERADQTRRTGFKEFELGPGDSITFNAPDHEEAIRDLLRCREDISMSARSTKP